MDFFIKRRETWIWFVRLCLELNKGRLNTVNKIKKSIFLESCWMDTFPPLWAEGPPAGPTGGQFLSCTAQLTIHTQGGRTWQPFVGRKNGNENFRQARIYNFCVKCVVFARNRKFAKSTQWNMQYIPCTSCPRNTVFDPKRHFFCPKISKKCVNRYKS